MASDGNRQDGDPLAEAARSFERHERALLDELFKRVWRDIPPGATIAQAVREIERAVIEDEDARELLMRVKALDDGNNGYVHSRFREHEVPIESVETRYRFALAGTPQADEALMLMELLDAELQKRLPADLSEAEREARVVELLEEDPCLAEIALRLNHLLGDGPAT
jgi:hypothetical protein